VEYNEFYSSRHFKLGPRRSLQNRPRSVGATTETVGGTVPTQAQESENAYPVGYSAYKHHLNFIFISNYKEFVAIKLRERKEMGWNEVHNDIEEGPFCEKRLILIND